MKRLGLLRHAKSEWDDMSLRDFDRGLNERGRKGAALMGNHIIEQGGEWDLALASPAVRVKDTLAASGLKMPIQFEEDAYLADSATLISLLRNVKSDPESILVAGHNPGLQELALALVSPLDENKLFEEVMQKYPTASYATLELNIEKWEELDTACGKLVHFARPRDLDPELGPLFS